MSNKTPENPERVRGPIAEGTVTASFAGNVGKELPDRLLSKLKIEIEGYQLLENIGHG
ncbi:MAG: hypothetical protein JNG88_15425, partial [Phycisphaerales bacterium]|nr:hypothetical protein [Phycisphaerales bacterium]